MKYFMFVLFISYGIRYSYSCEQQFTCEKCIRDPNQCVWCAMDSYNGTRCMPSEYVESNDDWCRSNKINPISSISIIENKTFSSEFGQVIQMKPQKMEIKLRAGQAQEFEFSFKNAADYPVDLYFLMDGSKTMKYMKDETRDKSKTIYETMRKMTNNVRLGMGTFVDKNTLPYTTDINSSLAYSFKHRLSMTDDFMKFQDVVNSTEFGLNYDSQEGTLDALAQVMVCKELIGWRQQSRKIVVVLTDSVLHAAGDGAYGGISRPYDGQCYSQQGFYTRELDMDYPSISLINKLAMDKEITIIFAVNDDSKNTYEYLSNSISGSKCESLQATGSDSGIPSILKKIYNTITSQLKLRLAMDTKHRDYFKISFKPDCTSSNIRKCKIHHSQEIRIKATIKLLKYYNKKFEHIEIANEGIQEKLRLKIETVGSCDCESEVNSASCTFRGTRRCGVCECDEGSIGDKCQCQGNNVSLSTDTCRQPGSDKICNGFGDCVCGTCLLCLERYSGKYCECNEDSCPRGEKNGLICSNYGKCDCGICRCFEGWQQPDCSCAISKSYCMDGGVECNNRGECKCGSCTCDLIGSWDARQEQNERCVISPCPSCHIPQCHLLEPCALCHLKKEECHNCDHINVTVMSNITKPWPKCQDIRVAAGCYTTMVYRYATDRYGVDVIIQSDLNCAKSYYTLGGLILGTLLLAGILTLIIWKYITNQKDKREFEKFEKELQSGNYEVHQNPSFQEPIRITQNPIFESRDL